MTDPRRNQPIPDPASQDTDAEDTSIIPDVTADPVEQEEERTGGNDGFGAHRPDLN